MKGNLCNDAKILKKNSIEYNNKMETCSVDNTQGSCEVFQFMWL